MELTGGCLCGHNRFTAKGEPGSPHGCFCRMCQRHSGAPMLAWVVYQAEEVEWDGPGGKPSTWRASDISSRAFCPKCGSTIGAIDDEPTVGLVTGVFDRPGLTDLAPVKHSYRSSRPRWWDKLFARRS